MDDKIARNGYVVVLAGRALVTACFQPGRLRRQRPAGVRTQAAIPRPFHSRLQKYSVSFPEKNAETAYIVQMNQVFLPPAASAGGSGRNADKRVYAYRLSPSIEKGGKSCTL